VGLHSGSLSGRNCCFTNVAGAGVVAGPGMELSLTGCRVHNCGPGGGVRFESQARGSVRHCDGSQHMHAHAHERLHKNSPFSPEGCHVAQSLRFSVWGGGFWFDSVQI
jgi:hypothetical protein